MHKLDSLIDHLQTKVKHHNLHSNAISSGNIGWHIEHSLLVITKIIETVTLSEPSQYHWKFNIKRLIVFLLKRFPRGAAEAPDSVLPQNELSVEGLLLSLDKARDSIKALYSCSANHYFVHPIFGKLNRENTIQFFNIHTHHHLKIIDDILQETRS